MWSSPEEDEEKKKRINGEEKRDRHGRPLASLAMTEKGVEGEGKESPRSEEKVLTMAEISQSVVKGAGRK